MLMTYINSVLIYSSRDRGISSLASEGLVIRSQFMDMELEHKDLYNSGHHFFFLAWDSTLYNFSTFLTMEYLCPSVLVSPLCSKHCQIQVFGFLFLGSKQTTFLLLSHSCFRCVDATVPGSSFLTLSGLLNTLPFPL